MLINFTGLLVSEVRDESCCIYVIQPLAVVNEVVVDAEFDQIKPVMRWKKYRSSIVGSSIAQRSIFLLH